MFHLPFFLPQTSPPDIYTLSLHDALPIYSLRRPHGRYFRRLVTGRASGTMWLPPGACCRARWQPRSEEHTSELQSLRHLVCRLLLEKKKMTPTAILIESSSVLRMA